MQVYSLPRSQGRWAPVHDVTVGRLIRAARTLAVAHVNDQGGSVLEVGVGTGLALADYAPHVRVTGIDVSEDMLRQARSRVAQLDLRNVDGLYHMDAGDIGMKDARFDHVAAMYVLSVATEPLCVLDELVRLCRPGGSVLIANHFDNRAGNRSFTEGFSASVANFLGWHPTVPLSVVLGHPGLHLEEQKQLGPLGLLTYLRFRRVELSGNI